MARSKVAEVLPMDESSADGQGSCGWCRCEESRDCEAGDCIGNVRLYQMSSDYSRRLCMKHQKREGVRGESWVKDKSVGLPAESSLGWEANGQQRVEAKLRIPHFPHFLSTGGDRCS